MILKMQDLLNVRNGIEQAEDEAPLFIGLKVEKTAVLEGG